MTSELDRDTGELLEAAPAWALSPTIAQLAGALAKAQGQMRSAELDRTNPHFRSKYMSLAALWATIRGPLSSNGLSVLQLVHAESGLVSVETVLLHESGECVRTTLALPAREVTAQALGSLITYLRRYALSALTGVVGDEDDDDAEASDGRLGALPPPTPSTKPAPAKAPKAAKPETITRDQAKRMFAIAKHAGWTDEEIKRFLLERYQLASSKDILQSQYDAIVSAFHGEPETPPDAEVNPDDVF